MRTTLTIDPDVAKRLEKLRRKGDRPFKAIVNDALRAGLDALDEAPPKKRKPYRTRVWDGGGLLIDDIANVQEVLTEIEGPWRA